MFQFKKKYFFAFLLLFLIEIAIAVFVKDRFVRPYLGDVLVIMLLYCFIRSFLKIKVAAAIIAVLGLAFLIEILQMFETVAFLGLQNNSIARTVLGSSFDWWDLAAYVAGGLVILAVETARLGKQILKGYG